jgi:hypothetical protein
VYDNYNALAIAFGPTDRAGDIVCSVTLYPKGAVLHARHRAYRERRLRAAARASPRRPRARDDDGQTGGARADPPGAENAGPPHRFPGAARHRPVSKKRARGST